MLVAEDDLVVGLKHHTAVNVVDEVEVASPVGVPGKPRVGVAQAGGGHVEVEARHELGARRRRHERRRVLRVEIRRKGYRQARGEQRAHTSDPIDDIQLRVLVKIGNVELGIWNARWIQEPILKRTLHSKCRAGCHEP